MIDNKLLLEFWVILLIIFLIRVDVLVGVLFNILVIWFCLILKNGNNVNRKSNIGNIVSMKW